MHLINSVVLLALALCLSPYTVTAQNCEFLCEESGGPVCSTARIQGRTVTCTFANECRSRKHSCNTRRNWIPVPGRCAQNWENCPRRGAN
ncbi:uncharacterized protein LOC131803685 [Musca domestica]|uniref:Uncharacterized protein LOC131803685 n=1 Tax=Musca domestica TaxID=7370 RepID=A0ABM3V5X9_MUSDO|nr:uncharacterized protein LOC131803685 [Musca domestica]